MQDTINVAKVYLITEIDMLTLNQRIEQLEDLVMALQQKVMDLSQNTEEKTKPPYSMGGRTLTQATVRPVDIKTGKGVLLGNGIPWNSLELDTPPANQEIPSPSDLDKVIAYNRHSHSRISGGALEKSTLEIEELDFTTQNKHSPQYWQSKPQRKKEMNSKEEQVEKIGLLDLVFNPDTQTWGVATYEIDVKKCYLVERDEDGEIVLDENGNEKKSPLYNEDSTKTALLWDKNAQVWRLLAVYAPGEP